MSRASRALRTRCQQQRPQIPALAQDAINRLAKNGIELTPTLLEPCAILVLVAFPNGEFKLKAELLPTLDKIEYSLQMLKVAKEELESKRAKEQLEEVDGVLRKSAAMPKV